MSVLGHGMDPTSTSESCLSGSQGHLHLAGCFYEGDVEKLVVFSFKCLAVKKNLWKTDVIL
jgi:hypothetical protein